MLVARKTARLRLCAKCKMMEPQEGKRAEHASEFWHVKGKALSCTRSSLSREAPPTRRNTRHQWVSGTRPTGVLFHCSFGLSASGPCLEGSACFSSTGQTSNPHRVVPFAPKTALQANRPCWLGWGVDPFNATCPAQ